MTTRAHHLLGEIAAGRDRIFAADSKPPGFSVLMQLGYAVRLGTERAALTSHGVTFLVGVAYGAELVAAELRTKENS